MPGGNGKLKKRKRGRPKAGEGVSKKLTKSAAIESDGSATKMAKKLGITKQSAQHHLQKPEIKKAVLTARGQAIRAAKLSRTRAYKQLSRQLDAKKSGEIIVKGGKIRGKMVPDWPAQDSARKDLLKVFGDYTDDTLGDLEGKAIPFIILLPHVLIEPKINTIDV